MEINTTKTDSFHYEELWDEPVAVVTEREEVPEEEEEEEEVLKEVNIEGKA